MKVWITKYALTSGIQQVSDAEIDEDGNAEVPWANSPFDGKSFVRAVDVHMDPIAAQARARQMRDAKIKSLERQIARLNSLTFEALP